MDFLLECIGFPPDHDLDGLIERIQRDGEPCAWRGPADRHLRYALGGGLELRLDRDRPGAHWSLLPHFQVPQRLRVAVEWIRTLPDSRFDALLSGWADPPSSEADDGPRPGAYRICTFLTDARRLPADLRWGRVLAVSVAGFALEVSYLGPDSGVCDPRILGLAHAARIAPLGGHDDPGGCASVSARIQSILHLENPLTSSKVDVLEVDAPGRPLQLFASRWQLEKDGIPPPRAGWRIEGTFMFSGRIAGGLPGPRTSTRGAFG